MSYLFVVNDKTTNYDSQIMEFESKELAETIVRQQVRDAYLKGQISLDFVENNTLICIGEHDPLTSQVIAYGEEAIFYGMRNYIKDLEYKDNVLRRSTDTDNQQPRISYSGEPSDTVLRV